MPKAAKQDKNRRAQAYVSVLMYGVPKDTCARLTGLSKTPGGFHPVWNEKLTFDVDVPQLSFVRFEVRDAVAANGARRADDPLLAQYTVKLLNIRNGLRTVPLSSPAGDALRNARLFVRVNIHPPQML